MKPGVTAEWDTLKTAVIHRPGIEMFFGLLEPFASLYERAFSRYGARVEHRRLEEILRDEFGVKIVVLKEAILSAADRDPTIRKRLVDAARNVLSFTGDSLETSLARREFEKNSELLDSGHFFNILLLQPQVDLRAGMGTRIVQMNITERQPLSNLYFMRDQQAVTDRGIFLSRMAKPQRNREVILTGCLWNILGLDIMQSTTDPGTFEGGDYIPMKKFALIGTGDRTNAEGVRQMLALDLKFDEVGVVHQPNHPLIPEKVFDPMIDMHLDTYFNVASSGVVVGSELLMKEAQVEIYYRQGPGNYTREGKERDLYSYITEKGFDVIDLTTLEQMAYAPNFLCIRDGTILSVEVDRIVSKVIDNLTAKAALDPRRYGALLARAHEDYRRLRNEGQFFPHKKEVYQHDIDAYPVILENLTGGYGAAHCMTCVLKRG
ncbi:MAG: arginine deiminase family protein [Methanomicrobiales archaeon]|nr:arginine deiminase family protein [Methanomicrobiales archaeon]